MKKTYKDRLEKFAVHLDKIFFHEEHGLIKTIHFVILDKEVDIKLPIEVKTQYWVFDQLVEVFPEFWGWSSKTGEAILEKSEPNGETAESVFEFFGIEDYELFCHLFCVAGNQQQITRFGGMVLTEASMGPDFAYNIYELLKRI